jgi:hypothetical protein
MALQLLIKGTDITSTTIKLKNIKILYYTATFIKQCYSTAVVIQQYNRIAKANKEHCRHYYITGLNKYNCASSS